jgi:hypothetical protein
VPKFKYKNNNKRKIIVKFTIDEARVLSYALHNTPIEEFVENMYKDNLNSSDRFLLARTLGSLYSEFRTEFL